MHRFPVTCSVFFRYSLNYAAKVQHFFDICKLFDIKCVQMCHFFVFLRKIGVFSLGHRSVGGGSLEGFAEV